MDLAWNKWENSRKRALLNPDIVEIEELSIETERLLKGFHFFDLPRELRDIVYGYSMTRGKVFVHARPYLDSQEGKTGTHLNPRYRDFSTTARPEWQLLAVSHQLRAEAGQVLFETNEVVFGHKDVLNLRGHFWQSGRVPPGRRPVRDRTWRQSGTSLRFLTREYARDVSIALDMRSVNEVLSADPVAAAAGMRQLDRPFHPRLRIAPWDALRPVAQRRRAHAFVHGDTDSWKLLCDSAIGLRTSSSYRRLVVDFTLSFCGLGCCRLLGEASRALIGGLRGHWKRARQPACLEIRGTKTRDERRIIKDQLLDLLLETPPGLRGLRTVRFKAFDQSYLGYEHHALHDEGLDHSLGDQDFDVYECVDTVESIMKMPLMMGQ